MHSYTHHTFSSHHYIPSQIPLASFRPYPALQLQIALPSIGSTMQFSVMLLHTLPLSKAQSHPPHITTISPYTYHMHPQVGHNPVAGSQHHKYNFHSHATHFDYKYHGYIHISPHIHIHIPDCHTLQTKTSHPRSSPHVHHSPTHRFPSAECWKPAYFMQLHWYVPLMRSQKPAHVEAHHAIITMIETITQHFVTLIKKRLLTNTGVVHIHRAMQAQHPSTLGICASIVDAKTFII